MELLVTRNPFEAKPYSRGWRLCVSVGICGAATVRLLSAAIGAENRSDRQDYCKKASTRNWINLTSGPIWHMLDLWSRDRGQQLTIVS